MTMTGYTTYIQITRKRDITMYIMCSADQQTIEFSTSKVLSS